MLSSGGIPNELLTTPGIIVEDDYGHKYLTIVSYGFPLGHGSVYHPNTNGTHYLAESMNALHTPVGTDGSF